MTSAWIRSVEPRRPPDREMDRRRYFKELFRLQGELVKQQDWVVRQRLKVG